MHAEMRRHYASASLSAKFGLLVALILTTIFVVTGALSHARQKAALRTLIEGRAQALVDVIERAARTALFTGDNTFLESYQQLAHDKDLVHFIIVDAKKGTFFEVGKPSSGTSQSITLTRAIGNADRVLGEARLVVSTAKADAEANAALLQFSMIGALALGLALVSTHLLFSRLAARPIGYLVNIAEAVAAGDLTTTVDKERTGEIGRLQNSLKAMAHKLAQVVGQVSAATASINSASCQIAASAQSLSQGTSAQAASVEQTARAWNR